MNKTYFSILCAASLAVSACGDPAAEPSNVDNGAMVLNEDGTPSNTVVVNVPEDEGNLVSPE